MAISSELTDQFALYDALERRYSELDKNNSGGLDNTELRQFLISYYESAGIPLDQVDIDAELAKLTTTLFTVQAIGGNIPEGEASERRILAASHTMRDSSVMKPGWQLNEQWVQHVREDFTRIDSDGNGLLSQEELRDEIERVFFGENGSTTYYEDGSISRFSGMRSTDVYNTAAQLLIFSDDPNNPDGMISLEELPAVEITEGIQEETEGNEEESASDPETVDEGSPDSEASAAEVAQFLHDANLPGANGIIDGDLSVTSLTANSARHNDESQYADLTPEEIEALITRYDVNGDGLVNETDISQLAEKEGVSAEQTEALVAQIYSPVSSDLSAVDVAQFLYGANVVDERTGQRDGDLTTSSLLRNSLTFTQGDYSNLSWGDADLLIAQYDVNQDKVVDEADIQQLAQQEGLSEDQVQELLDIIHA